MTTIKELLGELSTPEIEKALEGKELAIVNDGSWVPRGKFDQANNEAKDLKTQIKERDQQLESLKAAAAGNEDLTKQLADLKAANEKATVEYEAKIKAQAKDHLVDAAIMQAKGRSIKAVKALLNMDTISLDGENLIGLKDQMDLVTKEHGYLFGETSAGNGSVGSGTNPPTGGGAKTLEEQYDEALKGGNLALVFQIKEKLAQKLKGG